MICSLVLKNGCSQSGFRIRNQLQKQTISIHQLTKSYCYSRLASTSQPLISKSSHSSIHSLNQLRSQSYTSRSLSYSSTILSNQPRASSSSDPKTKSINHISTSDSNQNHLTIWQRTKRWSKPYMALSRIDKPIGTWLLFWPCAWSITLASHALQAPPSVMFGNLFLFGVGALVMRGAGCTINDMWDVKVDKMVERTKARPLAAGDLTYFQALSFLGLQLSLGLGVLINLNWYSILLGASSLTVVTIYPLMKRITYWPQLVLGLAFNWGALLGWSAIAGNCQWMTVLPLYFGSVCWTLVYDTIYAHQDKTDDITAGVKSTALLFSTSTIPILSTFSTLFISNLLYSVSTISPLLPTGSGSGGTVSNLLGSILTTGHPFFLLSISLASLHLYKQLSKTDLDSRESCWKTFVSNRDLGAIVWLGLVSDYLVQVGLKGLLDGMVIVG